MPNAAVQEFVERWSKSTLSERQAAQSHFDQLCRLVRHQTPAEYDPEGNTFVFEQGVEKATGGKGRADVWFRGRFAWEYKSKGENLDSAYSQLDGYRGGLENPPLLVVCNFEEYRIYPQWPNLSAKPWSFRNEDLLKRENLGYIDWLLRTPNRFKQLLEDELKAREQITERLAGQFAALARLMRSHKVNGQPVWSAMQVARFLTRLTFALFAEDVGLLPEMPGGDSVFRFLVRKSSRAANEFTRRLRELFQAMNGEAETFMMEPVPYFNGGIFAASDDSEDDGAEVLDLTQIHHSGIFTDLDRVSEADWQRVNPTIFGTLFERALDESKRAQLGAHYTSEEDIRLVIEPVLMAPLYEQWDAIQAEAAPHVQKYQDAATSPREKQTAREKLIRLHDTMMERLAKTRVLDPACGSGNFLYVGLRAMKDLEQRVRNAFALLELPFRDVVTPRQFFGIEKDPFAARLAQVVVWIGYLQWRYEHEGNLIVGQNGHSRDPRALPRPILRDKDSDDEPDRIVCDDSILRYDAEGKPYEPEWPEAEVIVGNPPFLGGKRLRTELGSNYLDALFSLYEGRVPHEADLVTYWFEKARTNIEQDKTKRVGLLATNSIRQTTNRLVLDRIRQTANIFVAWSDREWILEGANVRISIVGFDNGEQKEYTLNGTPVSQISTDLQQSFDVTTIDPLRENKGISFMADTKGGAFDIPGEVAQKMLTSVNRSGRQNSDVVRPWVNGLDLARRQRDMWIIDFGIDMSLEEARLYELPFQYVQEHVYPDREQNRRESYRQRWWLHVEPRPSMRQALANLKRYIATVIVAKHRLFLWLSGNVLPDHRLYVFARSDDFFFGVLHSYLHEIWALRLGSTLEDRPSYTGERCFETFPFPWQPGAEPLENGNYQKISEAARLLNAEREAWLNPPDMDLPRAKGDSVEKLLKDRTLTNLYNAVEAYRTSPPGPLSASREGEKAKDDSPKKAVKLVAAAREFAPRLAALHDALDAAVLAAYGWDDLVGNLRTPDGDEELLRRLLAENLRRAAQ